MNSVQINLERRSTGSFFRIALFNIFLVFAVSSNALAQAPVTYDYTTDPLEFLSGCPACNFVGQPVSGSFIYDPETPLTSAPPSGFFVYLGGISDWSGTVESFSFSDDLGLAVVGDNVLPGGRDLLRFTPGLFLNGFVVDGFTLVDVRMLWLEGSPGVPDFLIGGSLPAELPDLPGRLLLDFENPSFPGILFSVNFPNLRVTRAPTLVTVDINPGDSANSINPNSRGIIPVSILTTDTFDAVQVDPLSVTFGVLPTMESHSRSHVEDVDGDGDADLLLHFNTQSTDILCSDTEIWLLGETFDGERITGSDTISTVSCP
jgi:hypothetical protein